MNFRFDARKATQVAAEFIRLEGGEIGVLKLVKLVYLLDRASLQRRGLPVLGGAYYSMRNGPVTSELLDLVNGGYLHGSETDWNGFISDRADNRLALRGPSGTDRLSDIECTLLAEIHLQHGRQSGPELTNWCHENCAEWHPITQGRREIAAEDILEVGGATPERIQKILAFQEELEHLDALLA